MYLKIFKKAIYYGLLFTYPIPTTLLSLVYNYNKNKG